MPTYPYIHRESWIFKKKPPLVPKKGWKFASDARNTDVRSASQRESSLTFCQKTSKRQRKCGVLITFEVMPIPPVPPVPPRVLVTPLPSNIRRQLGKEGE